MMAGPDTYESGPATVRPRSALYQLLNAQLTGPRSGLPARRQKAGYRTAHGCTAADGTVT